MLNEISKIKPMRNDVLLQFIPKVEAHQSMIYTQESEEEDTQFFRVVAVGHEVKHVELNEVVVVDWRRMTSPFKALDSDGKEHQVGITEETEILAVVDGYDE